MSEYSFGTLPSGDDSRDYVVEGILPPPSSELFPSTLDYRPDLPPVRDQGRQGSCSAQAASLMKEWQEFREGSLSLGNHMSPQFIYNLRQDPAVSGMTPRDTMKILQKTGSVEESVFPYGRTDLPGQEVRDRGAMYRIKEYAQVTTVEGLKASLYKSGPCYIAFPVYHYGVDFWRSLGSPALGGHAVSVVGYTRDSFIIRNSWGSSWGFAGYTYFPFAQWGMHRECWTTVDARMGEPKVPATLWNRIRMALARFAAFIGVLWS